MHTRCYVAARDQQGGGAYYAMGHETLAEAKQFVTSIFSLGWLVEAEITDQFGRRLWATPRWRPLWQQ